MRDGVGPARWWKANIEETRQRHLGWWGRETFLLGHWGTGMPNPGAPHEAMAPLAPAADPFTFHTCPEQVAARVRHQMAHQVWPADILPVAWPDIGTVPLVMCLGARAEYTRDNVWYHPCIHDPASHPALVFNSQAPAWQRLEAVVRKTVELSRGNYLVGMPALCSGLDVLAGLRGTQALLMDLYDRPAWVHEQMQAIFTAYTDAFARLHPLLQDERGWQAFGYFMLWGPGKTGLCQCDVAAMLSPDLFAEFVVPDLLRQCRFLDHSLFHVDGKECLVHVDHLLTIPGLSAIQFTPGPKSPGGGDPNWYSLYRRILAAGKAVWITGVKPEQVKPLLDQVGNEGLFLMIGTTSTATMESLAEAVEAYR